MISAWNRMPSQWKHFQSFQHLPIHHLLLSALNNIICKLQYFLLHFYVNFEAYIPIYPDTPGAVGCCVIFRIKNVEGFSIFRKCKRSVLKNEIERDPTINRTYFGDVFRISSWNEFLSFHCRDEWCSSECHHYFCCFVSYYKCDYIRSISFLN